MLKWNTLNDKVKSLFRQGHYDRAIVVAKKALEVAEQTGIPNHTSVATSLNNLAELYRTQGQYAQAEPLYMRALQIDEKVWGPDHPHVATDLNNLALLYQDKGQYAQAEPLFNRSLAIREKALGPDHSDVAMSLNNLAAVYQNQGQYLQAGDLYKRAMAIDEKVYGPNHPDVATDLNNLALLYYTQGWYAQAEPLYERALTIDEKALGPNDPDVAADLDNLGALYRTQGQYAQAEPLYKRSLAIREKALGPDHLDVATSLDNLAAMYDTKGQYAQAEPLYKRSLAIKEKALGPDHPDVAMSLNNLAELYKKGSGPDHPDVVGNLNKLAELHKSHGQYAQAEQLYNRLLAITEKAIGPNHPDVAQILENLAAIYRATNRMEEAEVLKKRTEAILFVKQESQMPDKAIGPAEKNHQPLQPKKRSGLATASLVCGICGLAYPISILFLASIAGVVCGHMSLARIKDKPSEFAGSKRAKAGLIISYIALALGLILSIAIAYMKKDIETHLVGGRTSAPVPAPAVRTPTPLIIVDPAVEQSLSFAPVKQPKDRRSYAVPEAKPETQPANIASVKSAREPPIAVKQEDAETELREAEKKQAEMVAKLASAGNGPDLIESTIEGEFSGWDGDTIFKLSNGQIWQQDSYAYTYHYAFRPKVMIFKTNGAYKLKVDGVAGTIFVKRLEESDVIESTIEGAFSGWNGETIFKLANGQIWQQAMYAYAYHYAFRPKIMIIKTDGAHKMKVDGVSGTIFVKRLK